MHNEQGIMHNEKLLRDRIIRGSFCFGPVDYSCSVKDRPRRTQNMGATIQTEKEKKAWTA